MAKDYEGEANEEIKKIKEKDILERFEAWAELYYKRYHRLAPGKHDMFRDSNSTENRAIHSAWFDSGLSIYDCIHEVIRLKKTIENLERAMEADE